MGSEQGGLRALKYPDLKYLLQIQALMHGFQEVTLPPPSCLLGLICRFRDLRLVSASPYLQEPNDSRIMKGYHLSLLTPCQALSKTPYIHEVGHTVFPILEAQRCLRDTSNASYYYYQMTYFLFLDCGSFGVFQMGMIVE